MKLDLLRMGVAVLSLGLIIGCDNADNVDTTYDASAQPVADAGDDHDGHDHAGHDHDDAAQAGGAMAVAQVKPSEAATTQPANGQPSGTVTFRQEGDKVHVTAEIQGLKPNTKHGFHIHEKGDLSAPDLSSAGGHYNPEGHAHGGPTTSPVHAGDLGNIEANERGEAIYEITVDNITLNGEKNPVAGKAVIIHAKADDFSSQPSGDAGARIGGGIIEVKE